jgi:vancomycin resistance protein YoaR
VDQDRTDPEPLPDTPRPEPVADEPRRSEWWGIAVRSLLALLVLAGAYVALAYYLGDRIPNGTTVEGVDIGTLDEQSAVEVLEDKLDTLVEQPVSVVVEGSSVEVEPGELGLAPDYEGTVEGVTGLTFDPRNLWASLTGQGRALELRTTVDEDALEGALASVAQELDAEPVQAQVALSRGEVRVVLPEPGVALEVEETAERVADQWPQEPVVEAAVRAVPAALTAEEVETFVADVVEPAVASPVEVVVDESTATVTPNQLSRLLTVEQQGEGAGDAGLVLLLDEEGLLELVHGGLGDVAQAPRDAAVRLGESGRPEILPARVGAEIDDAAVLLGVREVLQVDDALPQGTESDGEGDEAEATSSPERPEPAADPTVEDRTVTVQTIEVEPEVTDEDADAWQVDAVMAEFRSQFPTGEANEDRTENIRVGLRYVNGSVVMPGEQFSLADTLAPITADRGYVEAGVIVDGRLVDGIGGGLSQVSTTMLNTAWFAGVELNEWTPHSFYISRYPEGREATIAVGLIDNVWTNDTDSPVVVQTRIEGDEIVMRFWGDRQYTVDTTTGPRRDIQEPDSFTDDSPDCLTQTAVEGFTVTVTRTLSRSGDVVREESWTTTYQPSPGVTCTG